MHKVLVASMPIPGHINPMVPIVRELLARGHEVGWYTGRRFAADVEAAGARFLPIQGDHDVDLTDPNVLPERFRLTGLDQIKFYIKHLFLDSVPGQIGDLRRYLEAFPADVVLSDVTFLGSFYSAELGGPPVTGLGATAYPLLSCDTPPYGLARPPRSSPPSAFERPVTHLLNWFFGRVAFRDVNAHADRVRASIGLPPTPYPFMQTAGVLSHAWLQATTPAFEYPRRDFPPQLRFIGPLIHPPPDGFSPPAWWDELDAGRPVVHVTQGTIANDPRQLILPTVEALAEEDVLVVCTTGKPVEALGPVRLPENVRAERFIPYHFLFPKADLLVTNAGYGGVQLALAHGLPLVAAGNTEDKAEICARIRWAGVGLTFPSESPRPDRIRAAVRNVLKDPRYRLKARRVQEEFARYHAPSIACDVLEEVAESGRRLTWEPASGDGQGRPPGVPCVPLWGLPRQATP